MNLLSILALLSSAFGIKVMNKAQIELRAKGEALLSQNLGGNYT